MAKSKSQKRLEARDRAAATLVERERLVETIKEDIATLERTVAACATSTTFTDNFLGFTDRQLLEGKRRSLGYAIDRAASTWTELKRLNLLCGLNEFERDRTSPTLVLGDGVYHEA